MPTAHNERYEIVVRYADRDLLQSGWLVGEQNIAGTAGVVAAHMGTGKNCPHRIPRATSRPILWDIQAAVQYVD
jgi:hypothetical protein